MYRNTSGQKITIFAFDTSTGSAKTGDSANLTLYVSKDGGTLTALTDTSATEVDATNGKGLYQFDLSQAETDAVMLDFAGKSSTANIQIVPIKIQTEPPYFSAMSVDSGGVVKANLAQILGTALTETAGYIAAGFKKFFNVSAPVSTLNGVRTTYPMIKNSSGPFDFDFYTDAGALAPGKTITATRSINGGAFASATGTLTEIASGAYHYVPSADDVNGDTVAFLFTCTGCQNRLVFVNPQG